MRIFIFLLWMFLTTFSLLAQTKGRPIIDMHQHTRFKVWTIKGNAIPRLCFPEPCEKIPSMAKTGAEILPLNLKMMDKYNVVLAMASDTDLEAVYHWRAADPERFWAGAAFFNLEQADSVTLRKELAADNLKLIGEIGVQYAGIAPNDLRLDPYFALANEFGVPVLIHCGGLGGGNENFKLEAGNPLLLQEVLYKYPDLRVYVENAGWPYLDEISALMYRFPNLYADLSTIAWIIPEDAFYTYLKGLINNGLEKRLAIYLKLEK